MEKEQKINFLFCNHPLHQRRVDEDYEDEYREASINHSCALFSYEDMEMGKLSLYGDTIEGLTIYRGWMMKPEMYRNFYVLLKGRGIVLINSPEEYERYHLLPGWYEDFKNETAETIWEDSASVDNIMQKASGLTGSYIVKDYVKSRKHEWNEACFIKDISDSSEASKVIETFVKRQDSSLVGGIVLRKFLQLKYIGLHEKSKMPISEEYRVFIYNGKVHIIDNYWTDEHKVAFSDDELKWIDSIASRVKSTFVTVDIARKEDGKLVIMEFGDGQVSGLQQIQPEDFYKGFKEL